MDEREQLKEFLKMLDFKKVGKDKVRIVENEFTIKELPEVVRKYLKYYFTFMDLIN